MRKTGLALIAAVVCSGGCNSVDGTRFNDQEAYYTLSSGSMTLTGILKVWCRVAPPMLFAATPVRAHTITPSPLFLQSSMMYLVR